MDSASIYCLQPSPTKINLAAAHKAMDPLSITATILQLTSRVIEYLNDVKDAPKDRAQCAIEASNLYSLLTTLRYRLEEGNSNEPWYAEVQKLCTKDGPLDQYKLALGQLQAKTISQGRSHCVFRFMHF